jgi:hypothetical protein
LVATHVGLHWPAITVARPKPKTAATDLVVEVAVATAAAAGMDVLRDIKADGLVVARLQVSTRLIVGQSHHFVIYVVN